MKVKINTLNTALIVSVLFGCKTWCLTFREVGRLKTFENMVMGRAAVTECAHRGG
jgi:hypothetical protein